MSLKNKIRSEREKLINRSFRFIAVGVQLLYNVIILTLMSLWSLLFKLTFYWALFFKLSNDIVEFPRSDFNISRKISLWIQFCVLKIFQNQFFAEISNTASKIREKYLGVQKVVKITLWAFRVLVLNLLGY